jgi:hypothetical protein
VRGRLHNASRRLPVPERPGSLWTILHNRAPPSLSQEDRLPSAGGEVTCREGSQVAALFKILAVEKRPEPTHSVVRSNSNCGG